MPDCTGKSHPVDCNPCTHTPCSPCAADIPPRAYADLYTALNGSWLDWLNSVISPIGGPIDLHSTPLYRDSGAWATLVGEPWTPCAYGNAIYANCHASGLPSGNAVYLYLVLVTDSVGHPGEHKWRLKILVPSFVIPDPYYAIYESGWTSDTDCVGELANLTLTKISSNLYWSNCFGETPGDPPGTITVTTDKTKCYDWLRVTFGAWNGLTFEMPLTGSTAGPPRVCSYYLAFTDPDCPGNVLGCNATAYLTSNGDTPETFLLTLEIHLYAHSDCMSPCVITSSTWSYTWAAWGVAGGRSVGVSDTCTLTMGVTVEFGYA